MWASIHPNQMGARPKGKMWYQVTKVLGRSLDTRTKMIWFVDFTEAYNRVHQPLLVDELKRRYTAWSIARKVKTAYLNELTKAHNIEVYENWRPDEFRNTLIRAGWNEKMYGWMIDNLENTRAKAQEWKDRQDRRQGF